MLFESRKGFVYVNKIINIKKKGIMKSYRYISSCISWALNRMPTILLKEGADSYDELLVNVSRIIQETITQHAGILL